MPPAPNVVKLGHPWDRIMGLTCECTAPDCYQHYSPGYGYFIVRANVEHFEVIRTPRSSLRILVNATQAICGHHDYAMFIASFHPDTKVQEFNCPEGTCGKSCQVPAYAAPAYWLHDDYFKSSTAMSLPFRRARTLVAQRRAF